MSLLLGETTRWWEGEEGRESYLDIVLACYVEHFLEFLRFVYDSAYNSKVPLDHRLETLYQSSGEETLLSV